MLQASPVNLHLILQKKKTQQEKFFSKNWAWVFKQQENRNYIWSTLNRK